MYKRRNFVGSFLLIILFLPGYAKEPLDIQTPAAGFYKGKTIRFIVGYAPGGGYDTYTRLVANYISKYIPGNPTTEVQNMTGGGSLIAANYTYNRAKPDGLTVGVWNSAVILLQALGARGIKFKGDRFDWIGAPNRSAPTCAIMGHTGLKTLKDVLNTKQVIMIAATRVGSTTYELPTILNKTLGTNFIVMSGYWGTRAIRQDMRNRELGGVCWGWESMRITARSMLDAEGDNQLIPFLTQGNTGDREIAHLPQVTDVIKGEDNLATFRAWFATREFQRPFSLPPGTPKDRLKVLRKAFKATVKDRRMLADARKSKMPISYVSGPEIEKLVAQILTLPPKAKENLQFMVRVRK